MENIRKFENISYDLSKDYLFYGNISRLDHHALILCISHFSKDLSVIEDFKECLQLKLNALNLEVKLFPLIDKIVSKVFAKFYEYFVSYYIILSPSYLISMFQLVIRQICFFIIVNRNNFMGKVVIFLTNLVMTTQGTVNVKETVLRILQIEEISVGKKYCLSAKFFLEDAIINIYNNDLYSSLDLFDELNAYADFFITFWTRRLTMNQLEDNLADDNYLLTKDDLDKVDDNLAETIFRQAIKSHNEMGVHYLWTNFISKLTEKEVILRNCFSNFTEIYFNIFMYLLLQSNQNELENFFNRHAWEIQVLTFQPRWRCIFFKVLKILKNHLTDDCYFNILSTIMRCTTVKDAELTEFLKTYFNEIPDSANRIIFRKCTGTEEMFCRIFSKLFQEGNIELLPIIMKNSSKSSRDAFFNLYGLNVFELCYQNGKNPFNSDALKEVLSENEIKNFKREFYSKKALLVCEHFLTRHDLNSAKWFLVSLLDFITFAEVMELKACIIFAGGGIIVRKLLFNCDKDFDSVLKFTESVLTFCLGSTEVAKSKMFLHLEMENIQDSTINSYAEIRKLVSLSQWKRLENIIEWKETSMEDKKTLGKKLLVDSFLKNMVTSKCDIISFISSFLSFIKTTTLIDDDSDDDKVYLDLFKLNVARNPDLHKSLIEKCQFKKLSEIIDFLLPPGQKIDKIKNQIKKFLLNKLVFRDLTEFSANELDNFIQWINETKVEFYSRKRKN